MSKLKKKKFMLSDMKNLRLSKCITFNSIKFVVSGPVIHLVLLLLSRM